MRKSVFGMLMAVAVITLGCTPKPASTALLIEDKLYSVTPDRVVVSAGIVAGEVTEMKVTERVEQGSGRIDVPAKLTAKLKLTNGSSDQTVRLVGGTIQYIDANGQPIKVDAAQAEPVIRFGSQAAERVDPGQDITQTIEVDFPSGALKSKALKEIRLGVAYVPSFYRRETSTFAVAIGAQ